MEKDLIRPFLSCAVGSPCHIEHTGFPVPSSTDISHIHFVDQFRAIRIFLFRKTAMLFSRQPFIRFPSSEHQPYMLQHIVGSAKEGRVDTPQ
jgi:hypothetical protein